MNQHQNHEISYKSLFVSATPWKFQTDLDIFFQNLSISYAIMYIKRIWDIGYNIYNNMYTFMIR